MGGEGGKRWAAAVGEVTIHPTPQGLGEGGLRDILMRGAEGLAEGEEYRQKVEEVCSEWAKVKRTI